MTKSRTTRVGLGFLSSLVLALAAVVLTATPAYAVKSLNVGNLTFTATSGEIDQTNGTYVDSAPAANTGIVNVLGGDADILVTTNPNASSATAVNSIVIGNGSNVQKNFNGTLTLQGVTLGGASYTGSAPSIQFNNAATDTGGITVVLAGSNTINSNDDGTNNLALISENGATSDTLVFRGTGNNLNPTNKGTAVSTVVVTGSSPNGGLTIQTEAATTIPVTTGVNAINVTGSNTNGASAHVTFTGPATLTIGDDAAATSPILLKGGATTGIANATASLENGYVNILAGNTPAVTLTSTQFGKAIFEVDGGVATIENTGAAAASASIYASDGTYAADVVVSSGTLNVTNLGTSTANAMGAAVGTLNFTVENGTGNNYDGPTVVLAAGTTAFGSNVVAALDDGTYAQADIFPWLVETDASWDEADPNDVNPNAIPGFAGMSGETTFVKDMTSTTSDANKAWVRISPHTITELTATALNTYDSKQYVWATTNEYLASNPINGYSGNIPVSNNNRVITANLVPTFADIDLDDYALNANVGVDPKYLAVSPAENVEEIGSSTNYYYVVPDAKGNTLDVAFDGIMPAGVLNLYPRLDVTPGTVNVVYTVNVTTNPTYGTFDNSMGGVPNGTPAANTTDATKTNAQAVTATDGSGTITNSGVPVYNPKSNINISSMLQGTAPALGLIDDVAKDDIGLVGMLEEVTTTGEDGTTTTANQLLPLDTVTADHNLYLTTAYAYVNAETPVPSPAAIDRNGSVEVSDTIAVKPVWPTDFDISQYVLSDNTWDGGFNYGVGGSGGDGSLESNGITLVPGDVVDNGDGTYTATVTVKANSTATYGSYRIWWANYVSNQNPDLTNFGGGETDNYGLVQVTEGGTISGDVTVWRLYNQWSHEHLYTTSATEQQTLVDAGWDLEGVAWVAPQASDVPVYRLYNPYNHDHYYCTSRSEATELIGLGWQADFNFGAAFYSANQGGVPIYQLFNPYETANTHLWTGDFNEYTVNQQRGWEGEGTAWYAVSLG